MLLVAILEKDEEDFLMNCYSLGKAAIDEFSESSLKTKNVQLLETIPKTKKNTKKKSIEKEYNFAKEKVRFLRHIDSARLQDFDHKTVMCLEISPTCFYLTKVGLIRKPNKSFTIELKK